jgi:rubrerythrin
MQKEMQIMNKLVFAIQMEVDGEIFYLKQSVKNQDNPLHRVFEILARAERLHTDLLRSLASEDDIALYDDPASATIVNQFANLGDFTADAEKLPRQLDIYHEAMAIEIKSIDIYQGLLAESTKAREINLMIFLIQQERDHLAMLERLAALVMRMMSTEEKD